MLGVPYQVGREGGAAEGGRALLPHPRRGRDGPARYTPDSGRKCARVRNTRQTQMRRARQTERRSAHINTGELFVYKTTTRLPLGRVVCAIPIQNCTKGGVVYYRTEVSVYKRTELGFYKLLNSISKKGSPRFRSRMVSL